MITAAQPREIPLFRVVTSQHGRTALWPARKQIPIGWTEVLGPSPRETCLDFVRDQATGQHVAPSPNARKTVGFGMLFFGGDEGGAAKEKYQFVIDAARYADANGFTAVWLPERHFTPMGSLYPNPAVLHAALARETQRVRLRSGSVVLPLQDPLRVAEEWAVVDNLSDGRIELSFAPGWNPEDFVLKPDHYGRRYEVLYEGIKQVQRLWGGQPVERIDGAGRKVQVRTYPTPVQKELSVWITVAGSARSFQQAGQIGANVLTHLFDQDVDELAEKLILYRKARVEHGWDPCAGRVAVALHTHLAGSLEDVQQHAHKPYLAYLKSNIALLEKLAQSRNVTVDLQSLSPAEQDAAVEWVFEKFLRQRSLMGTPDGCADLVSRLCEIGVQEIACLLDFGPSSEAILQSLPWLTELMKRFQ